MIKQLNTAKSLRPFNGQQWPGEPNKLPSLFTARQPLRKIRIVIDAELLPVQTEKPTDKLDKKNVLLSLADNELTELYRYADDGPPADVEPLVYPRGWKPAYPAYEGWAVTYPRVDAHWPVIYSSKKDNYVNAAVMSNAPDIARTDESKPGYSADQREADVIALHVASEAVQADLYITERPYLHTGSRLTSEPGLTVCTSDEAITIIGLYLRTQGVYMIPTSSTGIKLTFNKGLFYWVGTRELLPEGWRWFSACVQHSTNVDNKLILLGGSTLSRVSRALELRDDVHVALNKQVNNDQSDDALASLESTLMMLMGAIDATARVAHFVLGLPGRDYGAAWQKTSWLSRVSAVEPALAAVVAPGTDAEHVLTILRLLRNSVHGAALQGVRAVSGRKEEILVGLPIDDEAELLVAMDATGGRESWGFRPTAPGHNHIEPAVLVDKLFEAVIKLLNALMKNTPVERLPNVTITPDNSQPPVQDPKDFSSTTFSEWNRLSIRWQLGF